VSGARIPGRAQSAICQSPGLGKGLSPPRTETERVASRVSFGNAAGDRQRLGGALRKPIFSGTAPSPAICARQGYGKGVHLGGRTLGDSVSGPSPVMARDCSSSSRASSESECAEAEFGKAQTANSWGRSSLARGLSQDAPVE